MIMSKHLPKTSQSTFRKVPFTEWKTLENFHSHSSKYKQAATLVRTTLSGTRISTLEGKEQRANKSGWFEATKNMSKVWIHYEIPMLSIVLLGSNYAVLWINWIMFWLIDGTKPLGV